MIARKTLTHGQPAVDKPIALLQACFEDLESGDPSRIARWNADPYGPDEVTPEIADQVIAWLDERMNREIDGFPDYHYRRSGANAYPDWHRMPPAARLGLAQRLHSLLHSLPEA